MSIEKQLSALMEKFAKLQVKNKEQAKHIKLLQDCDDTSTEEIGKMDEEIEQLKAWQKVMQNEVDTAQDAELELLALRDENKQLKEFIKWGEREDVYKVWLKKQLTPAHKEAENVN